jgi:hypothetical protein
MYGDDERQIRKQLRYLEFIKEMNFNCNNLSVIIKSEINLIKI